MKLALITLFAALSLFACEEKKEGAAKPASGAAAKTAEGAAPTATAKAASTEGNGW